MAYSVMYEDEEGYKEILCHRPNVKYLFRPKTE